MHEGCGHSARRRAKRTAAATASVTLLTLALACGDSGPSSKQPAGPRDGGGQTSAGAGGEPSAGATATGGAGGGGTSGTGGTIDTPDGGASGSGGTGGGGPDATDGGVDADVCYPNPDPDNQVCTEICPETCNDVDDDCDRRVDEDASDECERPNATATCVRGECVVADCLGDFRDCDGNADNGCEVSIATDPDNCGGCGKACALAHTDSVVCGASLTCEIGACAAGWDDCDGASDNGCEEEVGSGTCDCAPASTDTDGDGTPDCNDGCPDDGAKVDAGQCGCGVADTDTDGDGTPDCKEGAVAWRRALTIDGSQVAGSLSDFPVLVRMTDAPGLGARARADGRDILFEDAGGAALDFEIERWDAATGTLVAWVRLPSLATSGDTVIYVVYGDGMGSDRSDKAGTWSNGFRYVWHLAQNPGPGGAGDIEDATGSADATAHASMTSADLVDAVAGKGIAFDGVDDELTFTNVLTGSGPHTISAWVDQASTSTRDTLISMGGTSTSSNRLVYSSNGTNVLVGFYTNDVTTNLAIEGDGWTYLTWTYDGSTTTVRTNDGSGSSGGATESAPHSGANTSGSSGKIGNATWETANERQLSGQLDEVRVATVARSAAWIATEYANQRPGSTFLSIGPEEAL